MKILHPHSQNSVPTLCIINEKGMQPETPFVRVDTTTRDRARKRVRRPYFQTFDVRKLKQEHMRIDGEVVTRKRNRELVRWKYCKDLDVRYFSSLKILKDRLQAAFFQSCKEEQCPVIRKRMESHRQLVHEHTLRKGGGLHTEPKTRTCVSIRAGASVNKYVERDVYPNNPSSHTSLSKINSSKSNVSIINGNRIENNPEVSGTSHDTNLNIPIRGYSMKKPGKAIDDSSSFCKDTCSKTEPQNFLTGFSRLRNETPSCNTEANSINEPQHFVNGSLTFCNDCCGTKVNQFTEPYNSVSLRNDSYYTKGNEISLPQNSGNGSLSLRNSFGTKSNKATGLQNLLNGSSAHRDSSCSTKEIYVDAKSNYSKYIALDCINGIIDETLTFNRASSRYITERYVDAKETYPPTASKYTEYTFNDRKIYDYVDSEHIDNKLNICMQNRSYDNAIQNYNKIDLSSQTEKYAERNDRKYYKRYRDACDSEHVCYDAFGLACNNSYDTNAHVRSLIYVDGYTEPCQSIDNNKVCDNCSTDARKYSYTCEKTFSTSYTEPTEALNFSRIVPDYAYKTNSVCKFDSFKHSNTFKNENAMPFINKPTQTNEINGATLQVDTTQKSIVVDETADGERNLVKKYYKRFKGLDKENSCFTKILGENAAAAMQASHMSCDQNFKGQNQSIDVKIRICVIDWLRLVYSETVFFDKIENEITRISDHILPRIIPLLYQNIHKNILKTAILNLMNDLPNVTCSKTRKTYLGLAEELTSKLLSIKEDYASVFIHCDSTSNLCNKYSSEFQSYVLNQTALPINLKQLAICCKITNCFKDASVECDDMVIKEASVILSDCYDIPDPAGKRHARNEIINLLVTSTNLSEDQSCQLAKVLMRKVRKTIIEGDVTQSSQTNSQPPSLNTVSVYTAIKSAVSPINYPVTSTPIKKRAKKIIQRLNKQEIKYVDDVSKLIRAWINTLPETFSAPDEQEYKEMIIKDLATDISDGLKVEQIAGPKEDKRDLLHYIVCRWVFRLGAFEIPDVDEQINAFLNKLDDIPVPVLTQPQHGNRQDMASIQFTERKGAKFTDNFIPKGTDIIEDQISIWMNEQSSDMFIDNDKKHKQDNVHDLAKVLENNLGSKRPETEVFKDIAQWLNRVVRPEKSTKLHELTEKLTDRVIRLPQDETVAADLEKRVKTREEELKLRAEMANIPKSYINDSPDQENTMSVFISNFIEHRYDIDDPLAKRAFNRLLHSHLLRLSPPTRKEVYDNFEKKEHNDRFPLRNMIRELEYIKDISDWLKNLPVDASYNTLGNRERTDFVNSLAISIREIEEDSEKDPHAMDYDIYMVVMIGEHLKLLPLMPEHLKNAPFMVDQLYRKIIAHRVSVGESIRMNESINTTSVNPDNIGDFIEEFIRINGADIANDEVKMEVWAVRLIREIKKLVQSTSSILSKAEVYEKLADVAIPSDETAKLFNFELDYVIEITNWMKNLLFLPMSESEKDNVTNKICELAEKITETFRKIAASPNDTNYIKNGLEIFVSQWISELPYDRKQNVVLPVATQQLINRVEKVKQIDTIIPLKQSLYLANNTSESTVKPINSMGSVIKSKNNKITSSKSGKVTLGNLVDAIEKFTQSLPIKAKNNDATIDVKNEIFRKLCQKVGELNMDRSVYNDDILYKTVLNDEIDTIFKSVPQGLESQNKKNTLKADLINTIVELKNKIKEKTAGDTYKLTLEKTIDDSIPSLISGNQVYDPGFEIYKDRLATMFILENFDHGTDAVKTKHEQLLKKEIDKYFDHANNRNVSPLSKDQLYGELYSNLFKVPVPNEASVKDEVEKIKTRREIDAWFEELPVKEATDLNELLDWDKMLTSLATRVHDIEISDSKPENKIFKVIINFLSKFKVQPGNENRVEEFAKELQKRLKSTASQRICVIENSKKRKNKVKSKSKKSKTSIENQCTTQELRLPKYRKPKKNTADEVYDIIQSWCNELPLRNLKSLDAQMMKDDLVTKMMIKITEINNKPEVFGNDVIYEKKLGEEIEHLLLMNPVSNNLGPNKTAIIIKLKEAIRSIKPRIEEERATCQFKHDLSDIVDKVLEKPQNILCNEKAAFLNAVKNIIIDDFILYKYSNDNDEDKQRRKINIQENVSKFTSTQCNNEKKKQLRSKTLMKTNELVTELAKILPQSDSIAIDEVEEIRMKKQVSHLFEEFRIPGKVDNMFKVNYLKESLAKKLNEIEHSGHTKENEMKMKNEIEKCLHKLIKHNNPSTVDAFITTLKNNEKARRMPRNMANKEPDSLKDHCRGGCYTNHETKFRKSDLHQINTVPRNFANNISVSIKKEDNESDDKNENFVTRTCGQKNIEDADSREDKEFFTSDEEGSLCLCEKSSIKKRSHYCLVPVRYFCDECKGYNSLWCKMLIPSFF